MVMNKAKKKLRRGLAIPFRRSNVCATTVISQFSFDVRLVTHI